LEQINERLKEIMTTAFARVHAISQEKKVDMRTAAYMVSLTEVARALELRGVFP